MNEHLDESSEGFGEVNSAIRPVTQQKVQLFKAFLKGSVLEGMHPLSSTTVEDPNFRTIILEVSINIFNQ